VRIDTLLSSTILSTFFNMASFSQTEYRFLRTLEKCWAAQRDKSSTPNSFGVDDTYWLLGLMTAVHNSVGVVEFRLYVDGWA
jgi:hypothetical protein